MSARLDPTNQMVFDHAIDFRTGNMRLGARYSRAQPAERTPTVDAALRAAEEQRAAAELSPMARAISGYTRLK